jgi:hypothetical protein
MYRPVAYIPLAVAGVGATMPPGVRRMWDDSVPFIVLDLTGTAGGVTSGIIGYAQG